MLGPSVVHFPRLETGWEEQEVPPLQPCPGWATWSQERPWSRVCGLFCDVYQVLTRAWHCGRPRGWRGKRARHGHVELRGAQCLPTTFSLCSSTLFDSGQNI